MPLLKTANKEYLNGNLEKAYSKYLEIISDCSRSGDHSISKSNFYLAKIVVDDIRVINETSPTHKSSTKVK